MLEKETQQGIEGKFEAGAERAPAFPFVAGALGSIALSAGLMLAGRREVAQFVGQWVPTLLLIGVYNKLTRVEHGVAGRRFAAGAEAAGVH
jgi:hypothetical protein